MLESDFGRITSLPRAIRWFFSGFKCMIAFVWTLGGCYSSATLSCYVSLRLHIALILNESEDLIIPTFLPFMFLLFFSEQKINEEEISALSSGHFYPLGF